MSQKLANPIKSSFPNTDQSTALDSLPQADYDVNKASQTKPAHDDCKRAHNVVNKFVNHQQ